MKNSMVKIVRVTPRRERFGVFGWEGIGSPDFSL